MDDEDMVGEIACQMIEFLGFKAVRVVDGVDAVKEYKKHQDDGEAFTAVIMDLTIPGGMGGGSRWQNSQHRPESEGLCVERILQ